MTRTLRLRVFESAAALGLLMGVCGGAAQAQSFTATHAKVDLVSEQNTLEPGHPSMIGVLFDIEKGWHIYWVNPGDSGMAPKIQWQLPAGFRAGEIRWPTPERLGTGTVIDYGYEGRVLLPLPVDVPADYKPGSPAPLAADVRYLICQEVCIPAKAHATLAMPLNGAAASDASARQGLFASAREHSPKPLPAGWKAQASDEGKSFVLSVQTGSQEAKATFFPLDEDAIDNAAPQTVSGFAGGVKITLRKSDLLTSPIASLRGVVVFGPDRAFEVSAPVAAHR